MNFLIPLAIKAATAAVGGHLWQQHKASGGTLTKLGSWQSAVALGGGFGIRFLSGAATALYLTNPTIRHGFDCLLRSIKDAIL